MILGGPSGSAHRVYNGNTLTNIFVKKKGVNKISFDANMETFTVLLGEVEI